MSRKVKIRRLGKFYNSYEDDAYVLHALTDYKVNNGKLGFPVDSLGKVESKLDDAKVSYIVIDGTVETKMDYNSGNYDKLFEIGKRKVNNAIKYEELIKKISTLSDEKLDKIFNYIESVINE